ncbi:MAG: NYN domain-containing protein [Microcoleus sp. PH2017_10_PVI_O_A]|uniref:NYN domain-containing protein n=2 Tax=unclassified Microcoleus TaxID=2642155 RepID=UPI001D2DC332|nr:MULTISPECIES: NYN domain-containing protein [unclassified Microcoleus]MCC3406838.1 NYN domain-containing protein [Microcoleus sp. PH2017_10_PVI_O_A]MCC3479495.1 NYN domain-containing protein [Microcoleus sp. PH2017_12_PCY_D_A]MCC3526798.1 NYN domain-containing protein [Microcoleus sp. PH2017_21_RUC_O_A]MCC3539011.1 NYN domain-containing protein [Microcoleus sp. PH2017_22_RUC_O_B]
MLLVRQMRDLNAVKQTYKSGCTKMNPTHRTTDKQTSKSQRVAILLDIQNVSLKQWQAELLLDFATSKGRLNWRKLYYNSQSPNQVIAKDNLEKLGFQGLDVPDPGEDSADKALVFGCTKLFAIKTPPEIVILVLGDRDFAGLIAILIAAGKKVIVFARRKSTSQKVINLVGEDNFHDVDELSSLVASNTQQQIENSPPHLTYSEAIECMIAAIQTASKKGQRTSFSCIGNLMRNLFPKYQGVTSVCKHQGKTFSRFSEFVETAVKDGKIRSQDQQLFVIEADQISA